MKDKYKTRVNKNFSIINRCDKVVYKNISSLSKDQFLFYKENGYLIIENFFKKEEISLLKRESNYMYKNYKKYYVNMEPFLKNKIRSILDIHLNKKILNVLSNSKLIDISKSIVGGDFYIHQSRINYKRGIGSNGWNWHSDFETWHSKDGMPNIRCFTFIIPLTKNTIENGCVKFIPKSHKYFIGCSKVGNVDPDKEFSEQKEGVVPVNIRNKIKKENGVKEINVLCKPTDLVIFDCNLLHGSSDNKTKLSRTNLYLVINSIKNKLVNPFSGSNHRPEQMGAINKIITLKK